MSTNVSCKVSQELPGFKKEDHPSSLLGSDPSSGRLVARPWIPEPRVVIDPDPWTYALFGSLKGPCAYPW